MRAAHGQLLEAFPLSPQHPYVFQSQTAQVLTLDSQSSAATHLDQGLSPRVPLSLRERYLVRRVSPLYHVAPLCEPPLSPPVHHQQYIPFGSAEGEALCRGSGPALLGDAIADSRNTPFFFFLQWRVQM